MHVVSVGTREEKLNYLMVLFLLVSMIYDIKDQKIPAVWLWGNLMIGIIYRVFFWKEEGGTDILFAILPGILLFIIAKITCQIGEGDGYLIMGTGCFFTIQSHLKILSLAFMLAAGFGLIIVIMKCDTDKRRIPFAPFVFVATIINYIKEAG